MPPEYGVCICRPYAGNSEHTSKSCYVYSVVQEEEHKNEQPSEVNYPFCPLGCKMSIHLQIYFVYVVQALCHFKLPNPVGGNLETHLLQKQQCIGHDQWNMFSHCELESEVLHISDRCSMARKHITTKLGDRGPWGQNVLFHRGPISRKFWHRNTDGAKCWWQTNFI